MYLKKTCHHGSDRVRVIVHFPPKNIWDPANVARHFGRYTEDSKPLKLIVPSDMLWANLMAYIRRRLHLCPSRALFFMVNGKLVCSSKFVISTACEEHDNGNIGDDGILHVQAVEENVFGAQ